MRCKSLTNKHEEEYKAICHIIKELDDYSTSKWSKLLENNSAEYEDVIVNHKFISSVCPPIHSKKVNEIANEYSGPQYLVVTDPFYLPPLDNDDSNFLPILNISCDMRNEPVDVSYRVGLLETYSDGKIRKARGFGFRFELRHGDGRHGYPHSQITVSPFARPLPECPTWIPQHIPCLPLPATCAVSLFLCMLISLYGKKESGKIISKMEIHERYKRSIKFILT